MFHNANVMYETMTVYRFSWTFFLTFIFFTAFAFLNMVIGIVVSVLEDERSKEKKELDLESDSIDLESLNKQLIEIKKLLKNKN